MLGLRRAAARIETLLVLRRITVMVVLRFVPGAVRLVRPVLVPLVVLTFSLLLLVVVVGRRGGGFEGNIIRHDALSRKKTHTINIIPLLISPADCCLETRLGVANFKVLFLLTTHVSVFQQQGCHPFCASGYFYGKFSVL